MQKVVIHAEKEAEVYAEMNKASMGSTSFDLGNFLSKALELIVDQVFDALVGVSPTRGGFSSKVFSGF